MVLAGRGADVEQPVPVVRVGLAASERDRAVASSRSGPPSGVGCGPRTPLAITIAAAAETAGAAIEVPYQPPGRLNTPGSEGLWKVIW